jgi:hypothetical protein
MHLSYYWACSFYHCIWGGCRSKKEQQKEEEECVSGIKMCVHAHFNFVNFSPSSSFSMLTRMAMMELERLKNQHLILLLQFFLFLMLQCYCMSVFAHKCITIGIFERKKRRQTPSEAGQMMLRFMHAVPSSIIQ